MLCVRAGEEWLWDPSSPLLERKVFELRGPNNSVAAKIDQNQEFVEVGIGSRKRYRVELVGAC